MLSLKNQALLLLGLLGIIWGSGYSIARYAVTHGVSPGGYTFWQALGPAFILSIICWRQLCFDQQHLFFYGICGLIGIAIPNTVMYYSSAHLPAGLLAVIINTVPLIIYPLALLKKQETFDWQRLWGVIIGIVGLMLLIVPHAHLPQLNQAKWISLALITPCCFALFAIFINPLKPQTSTALSAAAGMLLAATLLLFPWIIAQHQFYDLHWPLSWPDKIILLEIGLSTIGYVIFFQLLRIAGAVYYSMVDGIVALTGVAWGQILFHETFSRYTIIALTLIIFSILLVTLKLAAGLPDRLDSA